MVFTSEELLAWQQRAWALGEREPSLEFTELLLSSDAAQQQCT